MKSNLMYFLARVGAALHITLIMCIAGLLMFDFTMAANTLMSLNMIAIGIYWVYCIYQKFLPPLSIAFACIIIALVSTQLFYLSLPATTLHINVLILIAYLLFLIFIKDIKTLRIVLFIFSAPIFFTLLDMFINQNLDINLFARNIWSAAYIATGIWLIAKRDIKWINTYSKGFIFVGLSLYAFLLALTPIRSTLTLKPIEILGYQLSESATANTAYICIYIASAFLASIYLLIKSPWQLKIVLLPIQLSLFLFMLYTAWLPPWIGLIAGLTAAYMLHLKNKTLILISCSILISAILASAYFNSINNRISQFLKSEERIVIWHDAWQMQTDSSIHQWILGHGLMSFKNDFKSYSSFYKTPDLITTPKPASHRLWVLNKNFRDHLSEFTIYSRHKITTKYIDKDHFSKSIAFISPHNLLLDILYTTGLVGLFFITGFYVLISQYIAKLIALNKHMQLAAYFIFAALISNTVANGLSFSFFRQYNIFPLAFICGIALFMHEKTQLCQRAHD